MQNNTYEHIDPSQFEFVQLDAKLHDTKLEKKSRGYLADAMIRFRKNKSSVVAAYIILFLVLFALIVPIVSPYNIKKDMDERYQNYPPYIPAAAENNWTLFGKPIFQGVRELGSQNELQYMKLLAIGRETGMNPVIEITKQSSFVVRERGKDVTKYTRSVNINRYYAIGTIYKVMNYAEYEDILAWQNKTGIQVIYPYVDPKKNDAQANVWFKTRNGQPIYGGDRTATVENLQPDYMTDKKREYKPYDSIRIEGDDGSYIYSVTKSLPQNGYDGTVEARVCYYNYYQYKNDHEPTYIFGTTAKKTDLLTSIAVGARFSLIFAVLVSAINMVIGACIGAIMGYYGGWVDMLMDRVIDVLSGLPFVVCVTLFQLHLAQKVGVVPSFLFAYVLTGWIGMSALTRKQFYRFKGQEFVMAARTLGASDKRLMFKHIFPNAIGTIITSCALIIPGVISSETTMTYLGIVNLSEFAGTSIGDLMSMGQEGATSHPHTLLFPALFIALLLICFNLFGNGLRDAFNPSNRGVED